ncbi:sporozoite protein essential for cell traversal, putative [Plasmodium malariae]|uniref:Sporozoite protein essential for cell traversal, putative n=1 Tax=Plasmodium malariae TaxID=5858 RepID=A0A1A8WQ27_PLAMA|nr:sporozoite protein essential for cell traversal, putative [Plasmodium malariae]
MCPRAFMLLGYNTKNLILRCMHNSNNNGSNNNNDNNNDNKGIMFNSSESKEKVEKEKIKKVFNLILSKLKKLIHLSTMINYHTLLKFGNSDVKKETLEAVKNDDNISDELKKELIKYEGKENQDIKATELINFISPLYDNFTNKLNMLINELPTDLNQILK